ncbi:hypothetical protein HY522_02080 [bacterium]|nr:hypothetical protein [bacterium]
MNHNVSGRWVIFLAAVVWIFGTACGQKKIEGPFPDEGALTLRVLYLEDASLPGLTDEEIRCALELSEGHLKSALRRPVRLERVGREDAQTFFDRISKPFGKIAFEPRLDPGRPQSVETQSLLYSRVMELLRTNQLRPILPIFSLDTGFSNVSLILDTVVAQFEESLEELRGFYRRQGPDAWSEKSRDRRSVFAWYTVLSALSAEDKPADILLTNDLLIFDSVGSLPAGLFATAGITPAYTRIYPGVAVISSLPFFSDDPFFNRIRGPLDPARRLDLLALAISREVAVKLIGMFEDALHPGPCLARPWIPPFMSALGPESAAFCPVEHRPLPRRQLLIDYLLSYARVSVLSGHASAAAGAVQRLKDIAPSEESVREIDALVKAASGIDPAQPR